MRGKGGGVVREGGKDHGGRVFGVCFTTLEDSDTVVPRWWRRMEVKNIRKEAKNTEWD